MRHLFGFVWLALLLWGCSSEITVEELKRFAAVEHYPEDVFLDTVSVRRALIIVAHDDDDCAMSGTIARLSAKGWEVRQLSLVAHEDESGGHAARLICQGNEPILEDGFYRKGLDTIKQPYMPIPREEIQAQFLSDKVAAALIAKVSAFGPSVIFTLDNEKGGYGHPEHIFISQLVLDLFRAGRLRADRIYQSVYTDHMEEQIVDTWLKAKLERAGHPHASTIANQLYGISGMPEPTVQVNIIGQADTKMRYLRAYPEKVRKNLRKFLPYYEEFEATTYFGVFDREFFRVIEPGR